MHGNNLYLPIEGELQDTIVNVGKWSHKMRILWDL